MKQHHYSHRSKRMGRIKVLFCSFCLDKQADPSDHTFNQSVDVSHLATPHVSSANLPVMSAGNFRPASNPSSATESASENSSNVIPIQRSQCPTPMTDNPILPPPLAPHEPPPPLTLQPEGFYDLQPQAPPPLPLPLPSHENQVQQQQQSPPPPVNLPPPQSEPTSKLSYDIISVREPLAKILAQKQQLLAQQQQHEYIEVYGERGSSCFYEEIAGSVTSSATYDQIGTASNHNYQALINAYAEASQPPQANQGSDQMDGNKPSTSFNGNNQTSEQQPNTSRQAESTDNNLVSQSIPVYSVINKATRRSNIINNNNSEIPQPPPRYSKLPQFHNVAARRQAMADRPLPSPDNYDSPSSNNNNNNNDLANNDYELLRSNFDDDQIDVGYEKIRESNRYSGGSISSQFYSRQVLDNGGYESVQPIYSSPSNALAEPNYEAIGPATASELAAAATAKLTAAATVMETYLKRDE